MFKRISRKTRRTIIWITSSFILVSVAMFTISPYINTYMFWNVFPSLSSPKAMPTFFYGENIDMSQILPTSHHYIVNSKGQDLIDIAAELGINLIRITNVQRSFDGNADSIYTQDQWNQVLDKMQRKGIKALILIEVDSNNGDYYTPDIKHAYLHLVREYIDSGVFSNPDVYAVDIKNEPLLTDANVNMLRSAHMMIKAKYPHLKQTIGWWKMPKSLKDPYSPNNYTWLDFSAGQKIVNIVDFYSIHMYGLATEHLGLGLNPNLGTKVFISQVENSLRTTKPILIEEFGEANGTAVSDQDTIGSPHLQANIYQGVYQALKEMHSNQIIGATAFDFYTRNQYPDAWAIVKNNGSYLLPAAYILQEYALGKYNPSLQAATIVSTQSYLVTNTSNHTIKNIHITDRLGFKLQLDGNQNYSLSLSTSGILQPITSFHYEDTSNSYDAVYQAIKRGRVQLNITPEITDAKHYSYLYPTYTLTINVQ